LLEIQVERNVNSPQQERLLRAMFGCITALMLFVAPLASAQKGGSKLDGAWAIVRERVVAPDTTYEQPGPPGLRVVAGRYFSQTFVNTPRQGVQQAAAPSTAEEKAARYDLLTANAGTHEIHDTLITVHFRHAKNPAAVGMTLRGSYRIRGDTMWYTTVRPWDKDPTKTVRRTQVLVRQR
jgi:hypothetical protein